MKPLIFALFLTQSAFAGALYKWVDASGEVRYGYQPPPGVEAVSATEEYERLSEPLSRAPCQPLLKEHIQLIDQEIGRIKAMAAGYSPEYEFTPWMKQKLMEDLLAHRAALITGRPSYEFSPQHERQIEELKAKLDLDKKQLQKELMEREKQNRDLQAELERERIKIEALKGRLYYQPPIILKEHK